MASVAPVIAGERICIVMLSTVGGAVWTLPLVNAIKRGRPKTHIAWIIQPGPLALVEGHPAIDELIPFERSRGLEGFLSAADSARRASTSRSRSRATSRPGS
jgi:ADP-heptose:LPS heptosyltransferase